MNVIVTAEVRKYNKGLRRNKFADFQCSGARSARRENAGISGVFRIFTTPLSGMDGR